MWNLWMPHYFVVLRGKSSWRYHFSLLQIKLINPKSTVLNNGPELLISKLMINCNFVRKRLQFSVRLLVRRHYTAFPKLWSRHHLFFSNVNMKFYITHPLQFDGQFLFLYWCTVNHCGFSPIQTTIFFLYFLVFCPNFFLAFCFIFLSTLSSLIKEDFLFLFSSLGHIVSLNLQRFWYFSLKRPQNMIRLPKTQLQSLSWSCPELITIELCGIITELSEVTALLGVFLETNTKISWD